MESPFWTTFWSILQLFNWRLLNILCAYRSTVRFGVQLLNRGLVDMGSSDWTPFRPTTQLTTQLVNRRLVKLLESLGFPGFSFPSPPLTGPSFDSATSASSTTLSPTVTGPPFGASTTDPSSEFNYYGITMEPIYWPTDLWGSTTTSRLPSVPTFAPDCPGSDSVFYEASNGKWFILDCNNDHLGGYLDTLYDTTYTECCEACAMWPNCEGLVWAPTQPGTPCYLKTEISEGIPNPNIWAAIAITLPEGFPPNFETEITSTMTALPPGASLETLTDATYTENAVITTTGPGGHATVVPLIFPFVGPPIICWGCFNVLPVNVVIKLPKLCIVILGIKIGFCGTGGGGGHRGGDPHNKPDPDKPNNDPSTQPTTSPTSSPSTASTTSTVSVTATYESVFCSITVGADQDQPSECSTLAYSTVTGCDIIPSTTTTTEFEVPTPFLCSPDTCGVDPSSCPAGEKRAANAPPQRGSQPQDGKWAGPTNYGMDAGKFIRGEVYLATRAPEMTVDLSTGETTYNHIQFRDEVVSFAVQGLYGCTCVIALSRKGAWVGHFWENPYFMNTLDEPSDEDWDNFDRQVITAMDTGLPDAPQTPQVTQYALGELRNNNNLGELGHMFDDEQDPYLFVVSSRDRVFLAREDRWDYSANAGGDEPKYERAIERMLDKLGDMFDRDLDDMTGMLHGITYAPMLGMNPEDGDFDTPRGKLLIQYQRAPRPCSQGEQTIAKWRIWFENNRKFDYDWYADESQLLPEAGGSGGAQRDDFCPLNSTSSALPTSSTSPSTSSSSTFSTTFFSTTKPTTSSTPTATPQPPALPTTTTSLPPPNPSTTVVCNLQIFESYSHPPTSNLITPIAKQVYLTKSDLKDYIWSTENITLPWNTETALDIPANISTLSLTVRPMHDGPPAWTLQFRYGSLEWLATNSSADTGMPYSSNNPWKGHEGMCLWGEGGDYYCDRRVFIVFHC
ncbi:hypothetical protein GE09DRAFT_1272247 [Coniochaeta sp. 2T2.1]|nr:hypothetical protein GE09DRAFT_1272247 [Coniochaeta sp. 2T2.1]